MDQAPQLQFLSMSIAESKRSPTWATGAVAEQAEEDYALVVAAHIPSPTRASPMPALTSDYFRSLMQMLFIGCALFMSCDSKAWWDTEHKRICENAYALLNATAKAEVLRLLDRPFDDACVWADNVKSTRPQTRPWHYRNTFPGIESISQTVAPDVGDAITALQEQIAILGSDGPKKERREALMWIGHLVGDLHQPFHVAYAEDLGGNRVYLSLSSDLQQILGERRERVNMHAVWDGRISRYARHLEASGESMAMSPDLDANKQSLIELKTPADWADENIVILNDPATGYLRPYRQAVLTEAYLREQAPIAMARQRLASYRLASLLNQLFANREGVQKP